MKYSLFGTLFARVALASGFLSAVASRLGYWGKASSGWEGFLKYTAQVNSFLPESMISALAVASTVLETLLGLLLLAGYKTQWVAKGAGILTLIFAAAMTWSFGIKEPLDYSVFAFSAGAFQLSTSPNIPFSIDAILKPKN